jgi:Bacterial regulatory protein, Fis family
MASPKLKRDLVTQEMIIEALRMSAGIVTIAAQKLSINRHTLHEWIAAEPVLKEVLIELREIHLDLCEAGIIKKIQDGDFAAIRFYLNCFGKSRGWVETARLEGDATLRIETTEDARDIIAGKLAQLAARGRKTDDPESTLQ